MQTNLVGKWATHSKGATAKQIVAVSAAASGAVFVYLLAEDGTTQNYYLDNVTIVATPENAPYR